MLCKFCNAENSEDAVFCSTCGVKLDKPLICECGETITGNFCSKCGRPADSAKKQIRYENPTASGTPKRNKIYLSDEANTSYNSNKAKHFDWRKAVNMAGLCCAMVAIIFAMVFSFTFGQTVKFKLSGGTRSERQETEKKVYEALDEISENLEEENDTSLFPKTTFYFFGDSFKNIDYALEDLDEYPPETPTSLCVNAILSAVVAAAMIISVAVFSVLAIINFVKYVTKKTDKISSAGIIAPLCFAVGTGFLGKLNYIGLNISLSSADSKYVATAYTALNGTTVAGIVFALIFAGLFFVCRAITAFDVKSKSSVLSLVWSAVGIVLTIFVTAFLTSSSLSLKLDASTFSSDKITAQVKTSFSLYACILSVLDIYVEDPELIGILDIVLTAFAEILLVVACGCQIALFGNYCSVPESKAKTSILLNAISVVLILTAIILADVSILQSSLPELVEGINIKRPRLYTASVIAALVFSAMNLAQSIAAAVIGKKEQDSQPPFIDYSAY